jgi:hypothetical protein
MAPIAANARTATPMRGSASVHATVLVVERGNASSLILLTRSKPHIGRRLRKHEAACNEARQRHVFPRGIPETIGSGVSPPL